MFSVLLFFCIKERKLIKENNMHNQVNINPKVFQALTISIMVGVAGGLTIANYIISLF